MERFGKYNVVGIKHHLSSHQIRYNTKLIFAENIKNHYVGWQTQFGGKE